MHNIYNTNNAQFDDKIRPYLQKSSHLDFSPANAIFVLSCKEIRRRRRNGQAGARPCKKTVGDAGISPRKALQTVDIHQAYKYAGAPLSALFSLLLETFFVRTATRISTFQSDYQSIKSKTQFFVNAKVFREKHILNLPNCGHPGHGSAAVLCDNYFSGLLYPIGRGCLRTCGTLTDRAAMAS